MDNKGYEVGYQNQDSNQGYQNQEATAESGLQQDNGDDAPPPYPQNPMQFEGYANIGVCNLPTNNTPADVQRDPNQPPPTFNDVPFLTEDEAREALAKFVSEKCCYGSSPVKQMTFVDIQSSNTYQYVLESFTETRTTKYVHEPYGGQVIFSNGLPPPQPWDIVCQPGAMFRNESRLIEIPNTAFVETCTKCSGHGRKYCFSCSGRGRSNCGTCNGRGYRINAQNNQRESCWSCHGSGWKKCFSCNGSGRIICKCCRGNGRLRWYLQLKVEFKNNRDDFFKKSENIPNELLRKCTSKNTFTEQNLRVYPINNHSDPEINNASFNLITNHSNRFLNSRILLQKQAVNTIPMTLCRYKFDGEDYSFQVYGLDHNVYAPDYPRKCLCCTIL